MSQRMKLFIFLLIINLIVVVFYLIWNYIRRKEKIGSVWMKAVMMLLCPVTGPAFVLLSFLLFKLFSSQGMDLSDVVFSKDRKRISTVLMRKWREIWSLWKKPWKLQIRRAFVL